MSKIPYIFETPIPSFFRKNGWFQSDNTLKFVTWCFSRCSSIQKEVFHDSQTLKLKPFQFIFGRYKCSEETNMSEREVRTQQKLFEKSGMLKKSPNKTPNRFTIYEWVLDRFCEQSDQVKDQQTTNKRPQTRSSYIANKEYDDECRCFSAEVPLNGGGAKLQVPGAELQGGVPAKLQGGGAKLRVKEEPTKKNHMKNTTKEPAVVVFFECLTKDKRLDDDDRLSLMKYPEDKVIAAIQYSHEVPAKKSLMAQLIWYCTTKKPPQIINTQDVVKNKNIAKKMERADHPYTFEATKDKILIIKGATGIQLEIPYKISHEDFCKELEKITKIKTKDL